MLILKTIKEGFRTIWQVTAWCFSHLDGILASCCSIFLLLPPDEGRNGKCLGEKDQSPHFCDTSQTQGSVAGIREQKQEQGTQVTHSSKAAGGGGREDLEDERDGFGKPPTVKPFPPAQLLQIKMKNQLVSAILSGAHRTMSEEAELWTDQVSGLWTFLFVYLHAFRKPEQQSPEWCLREIRDTGRSSSLVMASWVWMGL